LYAVATGSERGSQMSAVDVIAQYTVASSWRQHQLQVFELIRPIIECRYNLGPIR